MVTLNQSNVSLSELMEMRRKSANLGGVAFSSEEKKTPSRQAMDKLLEETLRKAGLDLNKVEELRKQSESEMLETMAKRTAEADKLDAGSSSIRLLKSPRLRKSVSFRSRLLQPTMRHNLNPILNKLSCLASRKR